MQDMTKFYVMVQYKIDLPDETGTDLRSKMLQVPPLLLNSWKLHYFFDKHFLVVPWTFQENEEGCGIFEFRAFSLHPPAKGGGQVELRQVSSFQVMNPIQIEYQSGFLFNVASKSIITWVFTLFFFYTVGS